MHSNKGVKGGLTIVLACLLVACNRHEPASTPQDAFWSALRELCGNAYRGTIGANEGGGTAPDPFADQELIMHVRTCTDDEIRVPFHVGANRSRTWVFTRTPQGLRLKHDHRHEDGSPDAVTMYGGDSAEGGSAFEQRFPVDEFSRDMFTREGLAQSVTNTWIVTLHPAQRYSYALVRPGREFRVDFDLGSAVAAPAAPWGDAHRPRQTSLRVHGGGLHESAGD
jgi:hypothetical protein